MLCVRCVGFPAVNGDPHNLNLFDPMTPPHFDPTVAIGLQYNHTFTSELGAVAWSSWESMSTVFAPEHWSLHGGSAPDNCTNGMCQGGNVVAQRNYPCDSIVLTYWGGSQAELDEVGEAAFKRQLYHCLIGSALIIKGYIEQHRASNCFGLMLWQLNEIWPTGGWGSVEAGNGDYPGQVTGGRWKPSHHWLERFLYTDVLITCGLSSKSKGDDVLCFVRLDATRGAGKLTAVVDVVQLSNSQSRATARVPVMLTPGPGSIAWFSWPASLQANESSVTLLRVLGPDGQEVVAHNFFLSTTPGKLQLTPLTPSALQVTLDQPGPDGSVAVHITKSTPAVVLFLTLTTLAAGRFSNSALIMTEDTLVVTFHPWGALNQSLLTSSLRLEHANLYSSREQLEVMADVMEVASS